MDKSRLRTSPSPRVSAYHELDRESGSSLRLIKVERLIMLGLRTTGLILLYYSFSIGITFYQKWLIKSLNYPLIVVLTHLLMKYFLSALIRIIIRLISGKSRISIPFSLSWKRLAITGTASSLDISFSNWSFEFVTISLYTMTKSTCIIFILFFAIIFKLEKKGIGLIFVVSLIATGLFMFTYQSTQFSSTGFFLVLSASFLGGLRWTMAQLLVQRKELGLSNPIDMIYYIQPWMILSLLPLAFWIEIWPLIRFVNESNLVMTDELYDWLMSQVVLVVAGSILAFLMEMSEYLLLTYTSSLTLSIAGIFKEVFTLFLAYEYNGDKMSFINFIGLLICMTGIILHVVIKLSDVTGKTNLIANFLRCLIYDIQFQKIQFIK